MVPPVSWHTHGGSLLAGGRPLARPSESQLCAWLKRSRTGGGHRETAAASLHGGSRGARYVWSGSSSSRSNIGRLKRMHHERSDGAGIPASSRSAPVAESTAGDGPVTPLGPISAPGLALRLVATRVARWVLNCFGDCSLILLFYTHCSLRRFTLHTTIATLRRIDTFCELRQGMCSSDPATAGCLLRGTLLRRAARARAVTYGQPVDGR